MTVMSVQEQVGALLGERAGAVERMQSVEREVAYCRAVMSDDDASDAEVLEARAVLRGAKGALAESVAEVEGIDRAIATFGDRAQSAALELLSQARLDLGAAIKTGDRHTAHLDLDRVFDAQAGLVALRIALGTTERVKADRVERAKAGKVYVNAGGDLVIAFGPDAYKAIAHLADAHSSTDRTFKWGERAGSHLVSFPKGVWGDLLVDAEADARNETGVAADAYGKIVTHVSHVRSGGETHRWV